MLAGPDLQSEAPDVPAGHRDGVPDARSIQDGELPPLPVHGQPDELSCSRGNRIEVHRQAECSAAGAVAVKMEEAPDVHRGLRSATRIKRGRLIASNPAH